MYYTRKNIIQYSAGFIYNVMFCLINYGDIFFVILLCKYNMIGCMLVNYAMLYVLHNANIIYVDVL